MTEGKGARGADGEKWRRRRWREDGRGRKRKSKEGRKVLTQEGVN